MSKIKIICEKDDNCCVIPSVSPTVPIAEMVSNKQVCTGRLSTILIKIADTIARKIYMIIIDDAVLITESSILLLKQSAFCFLLNTAIVFAINTAIVVVFIPPAVDPGEPPMIIRIIVIVLPVSDSFPKSVVLNPAVLGETA